MQCWQGDIWLFRWIMGKIHSTSRKWQALEQQSDSCKYFTFTLTIIRNTNACRNTDPCSIKLQRCDSLWKINLIPWVNLILICHLFINALSECSQNQIQRHDGHDNYDESHLWKEFQTSKKLRLSKKWKRVVVYDVLLVAMFSFYPTILTHNAEKAVHIVATIWSPSIREELEGQAL